MIPLLDFVPEWNSRCGTTTGVNSRRGDSCRHDILWWYHVNKCRAMRGNRRELTPERKSPRCHVNTPNNAQLIPARGNRCSVASGCACVKRLQLTTVVPLQQGSLSNVAYIFNQYLPSTNTIICNGGGGGGVNRRSSRNVHVCSQ